MIAKLALVLLFGAAGFAVAFGVAAGWRLGCWLFRIR
jgi:hypothetical protein